MKRTFMAAVIAAAFLLAAGPSWALTAGETYTIEVDAIGSNGQVVDLSHSTTATADGDGKLSFGFTGLPTRDDYNFLLVTIKDSGGNTVRRSLAPAAAAGGTTNLGVSPMTEAQTAALLQAMEIAGSDNPVMALFGFIIVRSGALSNDSITHVGHLARHAILGGGGFNGYLESQIGAAKMATFTAAVQARLGGYSALIKDAVEAASADDEKAQRAAASEMLSEILMQAAAAADFDLGLINVAMDCAGEQAEAYLAGDGATMDATVMSGIDGVMSGTFDKLKAERVRRKYTLALSTLGASDSQITRLNNALSNLRGAMTATWQAFEDLFRRQDANEEVSAADFAAAQATMQTAMNTAFSTFMSESSSTNAEIDDMVAAMSSGFVIALAELNNMKDPDSDGVYADSDTPGMFTFWDNQQNIVNWPITVVVAFTWVAQNYPTSFTYERDTLGIPEALCQWMDSDHDPSNGVTVGRTDFVFLGMPAGLAALMGLREDIEIIQQRKWAAEISASWDLEQSAYDAMGVLAQAEADAIEAGNAARFDIAAGANSDDDWAGGLNQPDWNRGNDRPPYVTNAERQAIEEAYVAAVAARKAALGPAGLTADQRQALIDTATMPNF